MAFEAHRGDLESVNKYRLPGSDPGLAMLYYQIQMDIFWTAMLSYLHALAIANANGITAEQFLPYASAMMSSLPKFVEFYTPRLDEGSTLVTWTDSQWAWRALSTLFILPEAGIDIALPATVLEVFRRGMKTGHASDSFTSLIETFKIPIFVHMFSAE